MLDNRMDSDRQQEALEKSLQLIEKYEDKLRKLESRATESIAVVGLGCRFPGGSADADAFWSMLADGVHAVSDVRAERWRDAALFHGEPDSGARFAGLVDGIDGFDAGFFSISPKEARYLDPQQRMLLETAWEALESAGYRPEAVKDSLGAVFVGVGFNDYFHLIRESEGEKALHALAGSGNNRSTAAGRLSYFLRWKGPSMVIDTACSSALVSVHLACQSLRSGESHFALAGGVNLVLNPENSLLMARSGMLAPDGRCKAFDARADGFVRAEGCGLVALKRLSDAVRDGDHVHAVIRGSAVNQDGRTQGLMAPSAAAQEAVIRQAIKNARIVPGELGYLEAHGTGTALGDPIEMQAIKQTYGGQRGAGQPLWVGSVKTNIGHAEYAAGAAGLIKLILMLKRGEIPPHLDLQTISPYLDLGAASDAAPIRFPMQAHAWDVPAGRPRLGAVSSFGVSGTNAHVIVEGAPAGRTRGADADDGAQLLALSCRSEEALRAQLERYRAHLAGTAEAALDISFTALTGRTAFEHRFAAAGTRQDWLAALDRRLAAPAGGQAGNRPALAFLYSGQGSQYPGMGHGLYARSKTFRDAIDACAGILTPLLGVALDALLWGERRDLLEQTRYTQPALFALEYALGQLWRAAGIEPDVVMGHSLGEFVAACHAGVFSLEDGLRLVSERGRLMAALQTDGAMAVVFAGREQVERVLRGREARLAIGADNGPGNVVLSGDARALDEACRELAAGGIDSRRLAVSQGFHSPLMEPMLDAFRRVAQDVRYGQARIKLISNVSGSVAGPEIGSAQYWVEHVRREVRFGAGVRCARAEGVGAFVEIGPAATLLGMVGDEECERIASLKRGGDDWTQWLAGVGRLFELGYAPRWDALFEARAPRRVALPTYPFQRERHWIEADGSPAGAQRNNLKRNPCFTWAWQDAETAGRTTVPAATAPSRWLVLDAAPVLVDRLRDRLGPDRPALLSARRGDAYARDGADIRWNPWQAEDTSRLFDDVQASFGGVDRILYVCDDGAGTGEDAQQACLALMGLVQETIRRSWPVSFQLVTRHAQAVDADRPVSLVQAGVLGMARTLRMEQPDLGLRCIDRDDLVEDDALAQAILAPHGATEIALRGSRHLTRRLVRMPETDAAQARIRADGCYLITGGTGGLGLHYADWLAGEGARHLILCSRGGARSGSAAVIDALRNGGVVVTVVEADVSTPDGIDRLAAAIGRTALPLKGVIHAAGVVRDAAILNQDAAHFGAAFEAKVRGALLLSDYCRPLDLDFFIAVSSLAAQFGSPGQSNYSAANACVDALCHNLRIDHVRASATAWGAWRDTGMTRARRVGAAAHGALATIAPEDAKRWLPRIMAARAAATVVLDLGDRSAAWADTIDYETLLDQLRRTGAGRGQERDERHAAPQPAADVGALVRRSICDVLELGRPDAVGLDTPLASFGLDSLMAVEIRDRISRGLGRPLPAGLLFDHPTIGKLIAHLTAAAPAPAAVQAPRADNHDVAVIGIGCRFPNGADDPMLYWRNLVHGVECIRELHDERWPVADFYDPDPDVPGKSYSRHLGIVDGIAEFDNQLFGISDAESESLDPQQRLLLETAWQLMETAGYAPQGTDAVNGGIFIGVGPNEYAQLYVQERGAQAINGFVGTGNSASAAAGRLSYMLGWDGPSVAVDTACSSSLVAVHAALKALNGSECDVAIAGGVNLTLLSNTNVALSKARMLSPAGRCKTFDDSADGYVRGEGCGLTLLKRHADAVRDGDTILAVLKGSAVNQDGRSQGLTAPNGPSQEKVIAAALRQAGMSASDIDYVETHGTGTKLGDPIEVHALRNVFAASRSPARPLLIGSVKTNIGHAEYAAGIAGLIKVLLSFTHGMIPPHQHLNQVNRHIDVNLLDPASPIQVPTQPQDWSAGDKLRAAGVSSFGFSGTNAHVIVAEGPARQMQRPGADDDGAQLLALSCRSEEALRAQLERYRAHLAGTAEAALDISFTALTGRTAFEHRFAAAGTRQDWLAALDRRLAAPAGGQAGNRPALAFLYSGQGSQYPGMGHGLYVRSKTFRDAIDACAGILTPLLGVAPDALLWGERRDLLEQTRYTQPALFALEYALGQLWRAAGIEPDVVMGHSLGEFVAACHAGVFSLEDGLRLVSERGRLMAALQTDGAMAVVFAGREQVERVLRGREARLAIGADNGPGNVVLSGDARALDEACRELAAGGIDSRRLAVSQGFHSPLMEPMLDAFRRVAQDVRYGQARIKLISNVSGSVAGPEIGSAQYWVEHVRREVRFGAGVRCARAEGVGAFVEIGPAATLLGMVGDEECERIASLKRGGDDWTQWLAGVGRLFELGYEPRWDALFEARAPRRVALPTYPFQRRRYWPAPQAPRHALPAPLPAADAAGHPLLGTRLDLPGAEIWFGTRLSPATTGFLADHRVSGAITVPGAAFVELFLAAAQAAMPGQAASVTDVRFIRSLVFAHEGEARELRTSLSATRDGYEAQVHVRDRQTWQVHASARIAVRRDAPIDPAPGAAPGEGEAIAHDDFYRRFEHAGLQFGPRFRLVSRAWNHGTRAHGDIEIPDILRGAEAAAFRMHPAILDAALQVVAATFDPDSAELFLPVEIKEVMLLREGGAQHARQVRVVLHDRAGAADRLHADVQILDRDARPLAIVRGLAIQKIHAPAMAAQADDMLYRRYDAVWVPAAIPPANAAGAAQRVLVVAADAAVAKPLAAALRAGTHDARQLDASALGGVDHVVHVAAAVVPDDDMDAAALDAAVMALNGNLLNLFGHAQGAGVRKITVITRGAFGPAGDVAPNPLHAMLWGLCAAAQREHPDLSIRMLDVDAAALDTAAGDVAALLADAAAGARVAYRGGMAYVQQLSPAPAHHGGDQPMEARLEAFGSVDHLTLAACHPVPPLPHQVQVRVHATSLNFKDVLHVLGMLRNPDEDVGQALAGLPIGVECAGVVTAVGAGVTGLVPGQPVIAAAPGCLKTHVNVDAAFVVPKPDFLTYAQAAAVPTVTMTAYHALAELAELAPGQSVLIHSAAGGVGLAAVAIAQARGARVYATASAGKHALLRRMGVEHVFDSRTLAFAPAVLAATQGAGVDVVLNSLNGDYIPRGLDVLAAGGLFVEIGKLGIWTPEQVAAYRADVRYAAFDLAEITLARPALFGGMMENVLGLLADGRIAPVPTRVFDAADMATAMRLMRQGGHTGKLAIRFVEPARAPDVVVRGDRSYLITGASGALGGAAALQLARRGARHLYLASRSGAGLAAAAHDALAALGVHAHFIQCDVADADDVARLFARIDADGMPLDGIVHAAGALRDELIADITPASFAAVCAPKVRGTWLLHRAVRNRNLSFFCCYSSVSALFGAVGQGSYGAANAFMNGLMNLRAQSGLAGIGIDWGPWAEIGMAARLDAAQQAHLGDQGLRPLPPAQAAVLLDAILDRPHPHVVAFGMDWRRLFARAPASRGDSLFKAIAQAFADEPAQAAADPAADVSVALLQDMLLHILPRRAAHVSPAAPLSEIGLDSLTAIELRTRIIGRWGVHVPLNQLLNGCTLERLAERIGQAGGAPARRAGDAAQARAALTPDPAERHAPFPLTHIQHAYWMGRSDRLVMGNVGAHLYFEVDFAGATVDRAEAALNRLIARHDMLRMVVDEQGQQRILHSVPHYRLAHGDLSGATAAQVEAHCGGWREQMAHQMHAIDRWPLFEVRATQLDAPAACRLHLSLDMLVFDGRSFQILFSEIAALLRHPDAPLAPIDLSYRDYVLAERMLRLTPEYDAARRYWLARMPALPAAPELPLRTSPALVKSPRFARRQATLPDAQWQALKSAARAAGITPSAMLLTAFGQALHTWSRSDAFTLNLTLFNRLDLHPHVNRLIGDFTSLTLVEMHPGRAASFLAFAREVQDQLLQDLEHRTFNGVELIREMSRQREGAGAAGMPVVFTSMLALQHEEEPDAKQFNDIGEIVYSISQTPQVWLDHQVFELDGRLHLIWDAVEELFPAGMLDAMFDAYQALLDGLADPARSWNDAHRAQLPRAQQALRDGVNATAAPLSGELLHDGFLRQARLRPEAEAVVQGPVRLTYGELDRLSTALAHRLRAAGAQPNRLVGVVMDKGWEQAVAVLGILKAGAAYLPIDATQPAERCRQLLDEGQAALVVTQPRHAGAGWIGERQVLTVRREDGAGDLAGRAWETERRPDSDLAYVIFTSGSTGKPKGVVIDHRGAVNTVEDINARLRVGPEDAVLGLSALQFDLSVYDIFGLLGAGGRLVLPNADGLKDPEHWWQLLGAEEVSVWNTVPALMQMCVDYGASRDWKLPRALRQVMLSGDWIPVTLPERIRALGRNDDLDVLSLGGATEASIWSIAYPVGEVDPAWKSIPYGKPLRNQTYAVLHRDMSACPDWVAGDLYIGGVGLAVCYWRDEEKTAGSFVVHPHTGERLYRTGDLGRYLPDGNIEFLGREDFQVKVQGHRIELGEIEMQLKMQDGIEDAIVDAVGEPNGKRLVAYLVCDAGNDASFEAQAMPAEDAATIRAQLEAARGRDMRASEAETLAELRAKGWLHGDDFGAMLAQRNRLYRDSLHNACADLKLFDRAGQSYTIADILALSGIAPRYARWLRRALGALAQEGFVAVDGDRYACVRPIVRVEADERVPLADILREDVHSAQLYLSDQTESLYQKMFPYCHDTAAELFRRYVAGRPGKLRILEVGAGLGSLTRHLLPHVAGRDVEYTFTDISTYFLKRARETFAGDDRMRYALLNLDQDALAQGFDAHSFDMIVASSVLHATADIGRTLDNVKALLQPGGSLLMIEETQLLPIFELGMGLTQGFDQAVDLALRPEHPLLQRDQWLAAFERHGFFYSGIFNQSGTLADSMGLDVFIAIAPLQVRRFDQERVERHLAGKLPDYMVPKQYCLINQIPLGPNGKVDRKRLPRLHDHGSATGTGQTAQPTTDTEAMLCGVFQDVLDAKRVGIDDSFFRIGGDSLLATQLVARILERSGKHLPFNRLFESPTVRELARILDGMAEKAEAQQAWPKAHPDEAARHEPFALTDVQQAYWMGRQNFFDLGNVSTHIYLEADTVDLDLARFDAALSQLIERHDMLRMVVEAHGTQRILPPHEARYGANVIDLKGCGRAEQERRLLDLRARLSHQVIDVLRFPLFEIHVSLIDGHTSRLHISVDAMILDAWSCLILIRDFIAIYNGNAAGLPPLQLTFRDYFAAAESIRATAAYERARRYWLERIPTLAPAPQLPLAVDPGSIDSPTFARRHHIIDAARWTRMQHAAGRHDLTPSCVLLSAFALVLGQWSRQPRFTVNLTLFNRLPLHPQVNELVGDFTSLTLLETECEADRAFADHAAAVQSRLWQDLEHRAFSGVEVIRELRRQSGNNLGSMPVVFTSGLSLSKGQQGADEVAQDRPAGQFGAEIVYAISQTSQVWLDHQVFELDGRLHLIWDAVEELFPAGMLDAMFDAYQALLDGLADPARSWNDAHRAQLPRAQQALRDGVNATAAPLSGELLHDGFLRQARLRPEAEAVVQGPVRLTYGELDRLSTALAHRLRAAGAQPNRLVGVVMDKGWEQAVAVLGILKAGAAYLPIDATQPAERCRQLLDEGQAALVVTQPRHAGAGWIGERQVLTVRREDGAGDLAGRAWETERRPDSDLAYVIFTSGSTGKPKGVVIDHRGAVNTVEDINARLRVGPEDAVLGLSALQFDLSVYDIFGLLGAGGRLVLPNADGLKDPEHWWQLLGAEEVSVWNTVPALMQMCVDYGASRDWKLPRALRQVMLSGDWIPVTLPERIRALGRNDGLDVLSLGGATEASIWSIAYPVGEVDPAWKSIPYGKPLRNQTYAVLHRDMSACPDWVAGDLYIGGVGLAVCYWRDEEKTGGSFVVHPHTGERLYRTGDLGRYLPDGNIEFLGREDFQVKVQGHRIELGEIEAALRQHPDVAEALVAVTGSTTQKQLVAYVIPGRTGSARPAVDVGDDRDVISDPHERVAFTLQQRGCRRLDDQPARPLPGAGCAELAGTAGAVAGWSWDRLGAWLGVLQRNTGADGAGFKYLYPSAGSLYPVQAYLSVAPDSPVAGEAACYYYDRTRHALVRTGAGTHAHGARLYLVADLDAIAPLYGPLSQPFSTVEAGYMRCLLVEKARELGVHTRAVEMDGGEWERLKREARLGAAHRLMLAFDLAAATDAQEDGVHMPALAPAHRAGEPVWHAADGIDAPVFRCAAPERASVRDFLPDALADGELGTMLHVLHRHAPDLGVLLYAKADGVEGLAEGFHAYDPASRSLRRLATTRRLAAADYMEVNRAVYESGRFALFLLAARPAAARAQLQAGDAGQRLMAAMGALRIGFCPIGGLTADLPGEVFGADAPYELVHSFIGGKAGPARSGAAALAGSLQQSVTAFLAARLPQYMVPAAIVTLDHFPLTPNGKIDRKALPEPTMTRTTASAPALPANETESALLAIWRDVLGIEALTVTDNFFEVGGNSILMVQAHARIERGLNLELSVVNLFRYPTIRALAAFIAAADRPAQPDPAVDARLEQRKAGRQRAQEMHRRKANR